MNKLYSEFIHWLYENYNITNGENLIRLDESTEVQLAFLSDRNLPPETILEP